MRLSRKVYGGKDLRNRKVFNWERKDVLERDEGDTDEEESKQALSLIRRERSKFKRKRVPDTSSDKPGRTICNF